MLHQRHKPAAAAGHTRSTTAAPTHCNLYPLGLPGLSTRRQRSCLLRCQPPHQQQQPLTEDAVPQTSFPAQQTEVPAPAVARSILARRSVVDEDALHRPLGLVFFGAYVLGSAASVVGERGDRQILGHYAAGRTVARTAPPAVPVRKCHNQGWWALHMCFCKTETAAAGALIQS
jgi:hypothetical protein